MYPDYLTSLWIILSGRSAFGVSWTSLLAGEALIVVIAFLSVYAFRFFRKLTCIVFPVLPDYLDEKREDRKWFRLSSQILLCAECVSGKRVRSLVRMIPGIALDERGVFTSLGPIPFEGLLHIASTMRSEVGIFSIIPLFLHRETRKLVFQIHGK